MPREKHPGNMEKEEILRRIKEIRETLEKDQLSIIKGKILEREYHHHKSERSFLLRRLIEGMRKRLILETNLLLEPILDNQRDINLRFLREIERLKEMVDRLAEEASTRGNEKENQGPHPQDQG